jgi:hypothetical protein
MVALGELFTRSLRDEERRDLDRAMTVKTLAELRLCERLHTA